MIIVFTILTSLGLMYLFLLKNGENGHTFNEDIIESDLELDDSDVVKPDIDPPQKVCKK